MFSGGHEHRVGHPRVPGPGVGDAFPDLRQVEHQVHDVLQVSHAVPGLERDRERDRVAERLPHRVAERQEQAVLYERPGRVVARQHRVQPVGVDAAAEARGQLCGDQACQGLFGMVGGGDVGPLPQPGGIAVAGPVTAPDCRRRRRVRLPAVIEPDGPADVEPLPGVRLLPDGVQLVFGRGAPPRGEPGEGTVAFEGRCGHDLMLPGDDILHTVRPGSSGAQGQPGGRGLADREVPSDGQPGGRRAS